MEAIVTVERADAVAWVVMNQPERRNALTPGMRDALTEILERLAGDAGCRAVVLCGGDRGFCAGGDLASLPAGDTLATRQRMALAHRLLRTITDMPKPVIAIVDGAAFGAGMSLALACDYVLCSEHARFCTAFSNVGLMADMGLLWSLPQRVSAGQVRRLLFTSAVVDGEEALRLGLADQLAASGELRRTAADLAARFAAAPPLSVGLTKAALARLPGSLDSVMALEMDGQSQLFSSADFTEGRRAFLEKRRPQFQGR
ncbi:enoyl-CoA hydratase/isomerase family protein [Herbaspirillum sp. RV1423]|uniref:enoyl-CoA hydratase/isomerase family protein n=1 Tax=Herbaspirillum sp. RV1423 TaxID=1443993 RepID=UPI0004AC5F22|nr:enoyl-CoA hydratase-related protein [Herbaspirillum sp. RV1423]